MPTRRFTQLTAGALTVTSDLVSIENGKTLTLGKSGVDDSDAVNLFQLRAVESKVDAITAGSDALSDTLREVKEIAAAVDAANLASINTTITTLSNDVFKSAHVALSASVVPDEAPPSPMPSSIKNALLEDGWYFKNTGPDTSQRKINWYLPAPSNATGVATMESLAEIDLAVYLASKTSTPFVTVYTKTKPGGDNQASWYHSKRTYVLLNSGLTSGNEKNYLFRARLSSGNAVGTQPGRKAVDLEIENFTTSIGSDATPQDEILAISVGTNSAAAAGNVEFVLSSVKVFSSNDNVNYVFSNNDPLTQLIVSKVNELYTQAFNEPAQFP